MLLFGSPEWILGPEVGNTATYKYFLKVGTNFFDWFGKESEQEQLSVLAALGDYRAAIAPAFLPPGLILASEVLSDWRKETSQLPSLFACYINHFKKDGEKDQRRRSDPFGHL